jgi:hypothetical protein
MGVIQYDHQSSAWEVGPIINILDSVLNTIEGNRPYNHAYFPRWAFDEVRSVGHWTFGLENGSYIGLYSTNPVFWLNNYELASWGSQNCWIVEMGSEAEYASFEDFITKVSQSSIDIAKLDMGYNVNYTSPSQGIINVGWEGEMTVNNTAADIGPYQRWDNKYSQTPAYSMRTVLEFGGQRLILDFENVTRSIESI